MILRIPSLQAASMMLSVMRVREVVVEGSEEESSHEPMVFMRKVSLSGMRIG